MEKKETQLNHRSFELRRAILGYGTSYNSNLTSNLVEKSNGAPFEIFNDIKYRILLFTFQLSRKTSIRTQNPSKKGTFLWLENQLNDLLFFLKGYLFISDDSEEVYKYLHLLSFLYKLIAYTRDIYDGKGERDLTYLMLTVWYKHFPKLAIYAFEQMVTVTFGSWKDAKYLCQFIKQNTNLLSEQKKENLLQHIIHAMNTQLHMDILLPNLNISLVAKWIPREKSKFGWLFKFLVKDWDERFENKYQKPNYKKYRKMLTSLNKKLDTTQIKQCERNSNEIDYYKVSLLTKHKNTDYFLQHPTKSASTQETKAKPKTLNYDLGELCRDNHIENPTNILLWSKIRENIKDQPSKNERY